MTVRNRRWASLALAGGLMVAGTGAISAQAPPETPKSEVPTEADLAEKQKKLKETLEKVEKDRKDAAEAAKRPAMPVAPVVPRLQRRGEGPQDVEAEMQQQMQQALKQLQQMQQLQGFQQPGFPLEIQPIKPRLGVMAITPSEELVEQLGLKDHGILIREVVPDSPAEKVGIKANDVILEIGGKKVPTTTPDLIEFLNGFKDEALEVKVIRRGKEEKLTGLKLAAANVPDVNVPRLRRGRAEGPPPIIMDVAPLGLLDMDKAMKDALGQLGTAAVAGFSSTSISIINGEFTINSTANGQSYTIVGTKDGDTKDVTSISIKTGDKTENYKKLADVPKEQKEAVEKLLKSIR